MLRQFLTAVLTCVVILAVAWGVTLLVGILPLPFTDVIVLIVWIVAGVCCLWIMGRFLISIIPPGAP